MCDRFIDKYLFFEDIQKGYPALYKAIMEYEGWQNAERFVNAFCRVRLDTRLKRWFLEVDDTYINYDVKTVWNSIHNTKEEIVKELYSMLVNAINKMP
ncbi:hypothetical protein [Desulforamulus aquiferis]|uniref:Transposase IS204/IS1001/IS1096/IS1165 DDE domain-containing protein n=1 Tax=Desulforamulus aquiferis TaxID=1397668 RepID=A0AAW7ZF12_9FIRM|nr:hypothetical protein [Desulforamulus aquiferis]MDO7787888.1 hypothetical protein [Desulforamulus aquiferis]